MYSQGTSSISQRQGMSPSRGALQKSRRVSVHKALFSRLADLREQLCQVSPPSKDEKTTPAACSAAIRPSLSAELIARKAAQL